LVLDLLGSMDALRDMEFAVSAELPLNLLSSFCFSWQQA